MRCILCHRPLTREPQGGMGPRCYAKAGNPIPEVRRDLFGYDIAAACSAASERIRILIEGLAVNAAIDLRNQFAAARRRLGIA